MEVTIEDLFRSETKLKDSSVQRYVVNAKRGLKLCGLDPDDWQQSATNTPAIYRGFREEVMKKRLALTTLKAYILAVMKLRWLMDVEDKEDKDLLALERWIGRQVMKKTEQHDLSEKEAKNWRSLAELLDYRDALQRHVEEEDWKNRGMLMRLLIVSLYTLMPAQRVTPYNAITINGDKTNPLANGWLDRRTHMITVTKMKSGRSAYQLNYAPVEDIMNHWLGMNRGQTWLFGKRNPNDSEQTVPLSPMEMSRRIEESFPAEVKMNVDLLRKIYVNGTILENYDDYLTDRETARLMNHSLETHHTYYNKGPEDLEVIEEEDEQQQEEPPMPKKHQQHRRRS